MRTEPLKAVHDDDLDILLDRLGLSGELRAGRLRCKVCEDTITRDTLQALFPDSGIIRVICSKPLCMKQFLRDRKE